MQILSPHVFRYPKLQTAHESNDDGCEKLREQISQKEEEKNSENFGEADLKEGRLAGAEAGPAADSRGSRGVDNWRNHLYLNKDNNSKARTISSAFEIAKVLHMIDYILWCVVEIEIFAQLKELHLTQSFLLASLKHLPPMRLAANLIELIGFCDVG